MLACRQVVSTLTRGVTPKIERPSPLAREPAQREVISILRPKVRYLENLRALLVKTAKLHQALSHLAP